MKTTTQNWKNAAGSILLVTFLATSSITTASAATVHNGVNLNGISLNGISLNGISLNGVNLNGISLNGVNLNGISLNGVNLNGVNMNGISFNGISFNGISLNGISFNGTSENGAQLSQPTLGSLQFESISIPAEGVPFPVENALGDEWELHQPLIATERSVINVGLGLVARSFDPGLLPAERSISVEAMLDYRVPLGHRFELAQELAVERGSSDALMRFTTGVSAQIARRWRVDGSYTAVQSIGGSAFRDQVVAVSLTFAI